MRAQMSKIFGHERNADLLNNNYCYQDNQIHSSDFMLAADHNHLVTMSIDYYLIYSGYTYCDQFIGLLTSPFHQEFYKEINNVSVLNALYFMTYM